MFLHLRPARRAGLAGFLLALAALAALLPLGASAHRQGDSWGWALFPLPYHHLLYINYDNCSSWGEANTAANRWTATNTPIYFAQTNCAGGQQAVGRVEFVNGANLYSSALAWTQNYTRRCVTLISTSCWWDYNFTDRIDSSVISTNSWPWEFPSLSQSGRIAAFGHELGHSLGLAHCGFYAGEATGNYCIMEFCCAVTTPQTHDVNDINRLYPGW